MVNEEEYEYDDWVIQGRTPDDYIEFEADSLTFMPSARRNLLGHVAEWTARLSDWQVEAVASIADARGGGMSMEWGCFMCPVRFNQKEKTITVDTEGVW